VNRWLGGLLLEGWVVTEAVKAVMSLGRKPELYFWRSHDGLEVDLLVVVHGKLVPIEIKLTASPSNGHLTPISRFLSMAKDEAAPSGVIVCQVETERALPDGHIALPWHVFPQWLRERLA
jgi:predicted AAA+ superfamily ATPase